MALSSASSVRPIAADFCHDELYNCFLKLLGSRFYQELRNSTSVTITFANITSEFAIVLVALKRRAEPVLGLIVPCDY
jgi:hypothetical protein